MNCKNKTSIIDLEGWIHKLIISWHCMFTDLRECRSICKRLDARIDLFFAIVYDVVLVYVIVSGLFDCFIQMGI